MRTIAVMGGAFWIGSALAAAFVWAAFGAFILAIFVAVSIYSYIKSYGKAKTRGDETAARMVLKVPALMVGTALLGIGIWKISGFSFLNVGSAIIDSGTAGFGIRFGYRHTVIPGLDSSIDLDTGVRGRQV